MKLTIYTKLACLQKILLKLYRHNKLYMIYAVLWPVLENLKPKTTGKVHGFYFITLFWNFFKFLFYVFVLP